MAEPPSGRTVIGERVMTLAHAGPGGWRGVEALTAALAAAVPATAYLVAARRLRARMRRPWSGWRTAGFVLGSALVGLAVSPQVEHLAEIDARGHMAQHLLLGMYAPLALVLGAPLTLVLGNVPAGVGRRLRALLGSRPLRLASHVATAAILDVGGLFLLYTTPLYAFTEQHEAAHRLVHLHLLVAGSLFAWAIAGPDPAPGRPRMATRVAVLIVASGLHAFLAKLMYARAGAWPPGASWSAVEAASAAQVMYYGGHLAEVLLVVALFRGWYRRRARLGVAHRRIAPGQAAHPG
jgi:putative membrane protein